MFVVSVTYFHGCTQHLSLTAPVSWLAELLPSTQRRQYTVRVLVVRYTVQTVVASRKRVGGDNFNRPRRIAQSQRTRADLLAIVNKSHVARTCSIREFFLRCFRRDEVADDVLLDSSVTFIFYPSFRSN